MALNLSAPIIATGAGVTASAVAVSSVAIVNQVSLNKPPGTTLLQDKQLYRVSNTYFDRDDIFDFQKNFDTHKANKNDENQPLLPIVKGGCLRGFFPGVELKRPDKEADDKKDLNSVVPNDFTFEGESSLLGCKMMKFSEANNQAGFGYMAETTLQGRKFGLAIYSALTNLKNKDTTDAEYWLLFLKKDGGKWAVADSYRWTKSMKELVKGGESATYKQESFNVKRDHNTNIWWRWSATAPTETQKFFNGGQDTSSLWGSKDSFYAGLWFTDNKGGTKEDMLYSGSNEGWALRDRFDGKTNPPAETNKFLKKVKWDRQGVWATIDGHCHSLHTERAKEPDIFEGEKNICFSKKINNGSGKRDAK